MDEFYNKHYIKTRADGAIIDCWSNGPHPDRDTTDAICISDKGGYQFRFTPDVEEIPPFYDVDGIPLYKWDGQAVQPRTAEEIAADRAAIPEPPPSEMEQLRADNALLRAQIAAASGRQDFLEDCIAEMAAQVYNV